MYKDSMVLQSIITRSLSNEKISIPDRRSTRVLKVGTRLCMTLSLSVDRSLLNPCSVLGEKILDLTSAS